MAADQVDELRQRGSRIEVPTPRTTGRDSRARRGPGSHEIGFSLILFLTFLGHQTVWAQSELPVAGVVRVQSRTTLWAEVSTDGTTLTGHLADDLDRRLADRIVDIESAEVLRQVRTDRSGEFAVSLSSAPGAQRITVTFRGDAYHAGTAITRDFDPGRGVVHVQLLAPSEVLLDMDHVEVQVRAEHGDQPVQVPITIALLPSGPELGTARTDDRGWASVTLETAALGAPGRRRLDASFAGDRLFSPASAQAAILVVDVTSVSLVPDRQRLLPDEHLRLTGDLEGAAGPIAGEVVEVLAGEQVIQTVSTGADGAFEVRVSGRTLSAGDQNVLRARYQSPLPWRRSCQSSDFVIDVEEPTPMGWGRALVALGLTAVLLALVLWLTSRRRVRTKARSLMPDQAVASGLQPAPLASRSARKADCFDLGGRVVDPVRPGPVSGASVTVTHGADRRSDRTSREGQFMLTRLASGRHDVMVAAAGYVPESFFAEVPHHGKLRSMDVHIVQVRHRALEVYRSVARRVLPRASLWNHWTPREVAIHAVRKSPTSADDLAELTSCFEEVYYSHKTNTMMDLQRIRELVSRLEQSWQAPQAGSEDG